MTKLLSAKELLEVVRTAQVDAQAAGGGAKWPPRMALGGRSGPRRRALERARERDAQNVAPPPAAAPFRVQRGGTMPVMEAVRPPAAPLQAPPAPFGMPSSRGPEAPPAAPMPAVGLSDELPPASAILAAMRAKGGAVLPTPREPEPMEVKSERLVMPDTPPSNVPPAMDSHRARTERDPRAQAAFDRAAQETPVNARTAAPLPFVPEEAALAPPARSLAALFPPPLRQPEPPQPARSPAHTIPEPAARRASSSIARDEPLDVRSAPLVAIDLPDLDIEVTQAPRRAAIPKATADARAREEDEPPRRNRAEARTTRLDRPKLDVDRRAEPDPNADSAGSPAAPPAASEMKRERTGGSTALSAFAKLASSPQSSREEGRATTGSHATGAAALGAIAAPAQAPAAAPPIDISWLSAKPEWAPASAPIDDADGSTPVALSQDETIVLLNYDAQASLEAISAKTGFSVYKVERIVERLMDHGVFEDLPAAPTERVETKFHTPNRDLYAPPPQSMVALVSAALDAPPDSLEGPATEADPRPTDGPDIELNEADDDDGIDSDDLPPASGTSDDDDEPNDAELEANIRKLYESKLSRLDADRRVAIATESGVGAFELFALVYDKDPTVAKALFENVHFLTDHARFAAFHHVTSFGLDRLAMRNELVKDPMVQRRLLRNAHTSELVVRRILGPKRLLDIYKITNDRDVPDRQRMVARGSLRQKFQTADPEERLQLLWNTEGRALTLLSGCPIDSKTTALFCARPVISLIMVQNFSKFGATPPGIIGHFLKQNLVRRQIGIRNMLLKHPNCPSDAKKQF